MKSPINNTASPSRHYEFSDNKDDRKLYAANPFPGLFSNDSILKPDPKNGSAYSAFTAANNTSSKIPEVVAAPINPPMSSGNPSKLPP